MAKDFDECQALSSIQKWIHLPTGIYKRSSSKPHQESRERPRVSEARRQASFNDVPLDPPSVVRDAEAQHTKKDKTILYLAYGSNLRDETFLGKRKIRPLSQINVLVPEVVMTFDLPGIPYKEPCFSNVRYRAPKDEMQVGNEDYHKDRWHKGLVGVVYEVTMADYAHIIATEGGGAGYQDVLVDCYPLDSNPKAVVPVQPSSTPFKAHTLFDPAGQHRADPSYAQPSARYLKLITDGAMERGLPYEYQDYLHQIRVYSVTTTRQRIGQALFLALWGPIFLLLMQGAAALFARRDGTYPPWLARLLRAMFTACWSSYDQFFKPRFGDGERTIGDSKDGVLDSAEDEKAPLVRDMIRTYGINGRLPTV